MRTIHVPFSEHDLELFKNEIVYSEGTVSWNMATEDGEVIEILFMTDAEFERLEEEK